MILKDKLKELRTKQSFTQDMVAEYLGVSSQTVSKWERGISEPDISLLPKIAVLYKCSIDSIFEMDSYWDSEHKKELSEAIQSLYAKKDYKSAYNLLLSEIEIHPNEFANYIDIMLLVLRQNMFDDEFLKKMLSLSSRAERYCTDDDIRNEIHRLMIQICSNSQNINYKNKAVDFYNKLPLLKHSREVYAKFVMSDDDLLLQIKKNIIYTADLEECAIRQLINTEMSPEQKLFYYEKASKVYEIVLDDKFGGFYDIPLISNYIQMARIYMEIEQNAKGEDYIYKIIRIIERHTDKKEQVDISPLLYATNLSNHTTAAVNCRKVLQSLISDPLFCKFKPQFEALYYNLLDK